MTGSIRIFEKLNFTPKLSALAFLKVKLPNMTDWHIMLQHNMLSSPVEFSSHSSITTAWLFKYKIPFLI